MTVVSDEVDSIPTDVEVAERDVGQLCERLAQFTVVVQPALLITVILVTEPEARPLKTLLACGLPLLSL